MGRRGCKAWRGGGIPLLRSEEGQQQLRSCGNGGFSRYGAIFRGKNRRQQTVPQRGRAEAGS